MRLPSTLPLQSFVTPPSLTAEGCRSSLHLQDTAGNVAWAAESKTLFNVTKDQLNRPCKVILRILLLCCSGDRPHCWWHDLACLCLQRRVCVRDSELLCSYMTLVAHSWCKWLLGRSQLQGSYSQATLLPTGLRRSCQVLCEQLCVASVAVHEPLHEPGLLCCGISLLTCGSDGPSWTAAGQIHQNQWP